MVDLSGGGRVYSLPTRAMCRTPFPEFRLGPTLHAAIQPGASGEVGCVGFLDPAFVLGHAAGIAGKGARNSGRSAQGRVDGLVDSLAGERVVGECRVADGDPVRAGDGPADYRSC